jgi:hypothetical protein
MTRLSACKTRYTGCGALISSVSSATIDAIVHVLTS